MADVLITGGAGFIGRATVARCVEAGRDVTVVDNLATGRREHLESFDGKISFFEADILDRGRMEEIFAAAAPETVIHLAAHHFIPFCNGHPSETLRTNVEGSHVVLSTAAVTGVEHAVIASTGGIYPSVTEPIGEELPIAPPDIYGLSKALMEDVARLVTRAGSMTCVVARLFNTYGPCETNPHLIPEIILGLREGNTLRLGNLETKRDYIFVDDVAEFLLASCDQHSEGLTVVNVGTGFEYSAREIVDTIARLLGRDITIDVDSARLRKVDKKNQRADTRKLEALTSRRARHSLEEGLQKLLVHEGLM